MEMINRNRTNAGLLGGFRNLSSCSAGFLLCELWDCGKGGTGAEVAHFSEIALISNLGCDSNLFNHTIKAEKNHLGAGLCLPRVCMDCRSVGHPSSVWR